jgi:hypothetical protein
MFFLAHGMFGEYDELVTVIFGIVILGFLFYVWYTMYRQPTELTDDNVATKEDTRIQPLD